MMTYVPQAALSDAHNVRTEALGDGSRIISATIVGHDDFTADVVRCHRLPGFGNAGTDRLRFIQTGDHHGQFDVLAVNAIQALRWPFETSHVMISDDQFAD
jgi:hypothetical protein